MPPAVTLAVGRRVACVGDHFAWRPSGVIRPGDPVTLGTGQNREQDRRTWTRVPTSQKQPLFSTHGLVSYGSFALVVDRKAASSV
jgi:hypothetical protein